MSEPLLCYWAKSVLKQANCIHDMYPLCHHFEILLHSISFSRITGSIALFVLTNDDDAVVVVAVVVLLLLYLSCPTIVVIFNNTN